jgi:peptidoglycan/LPS O-acetylase OafA/YrhL
MADSSSRVISAAEAPVGRIPALDGIRGLAICLVLWWHLAVSPVRANLQNLQNHPGLLRIAELGRFTWSGVDLFFVLSGFLIGGILLDASRSPSYFSTFYIRRAYRIIPLYAVIILSTLVLIAIYGQLGWSRYAKELSYYVVFLQNFRMAATQSFGPLGLGATWSLAIEEQSYLTLPIVVRKISRRVLWRVLLAAVVAAPLLRILCMKFLKMQWIAVYVLMPCRADALCLGVLIAMAIRSPSVWGTIMARRRYVYAALALACVVGIWMLMGHVQPFTTELLGLEYSLLTLIYSLLLVSTLISARLSSLFSFPLLRFLGTIAYGLYLFQSLVSFALERVMLHFGRAADMVATFQLSFLAVLTCIGLAATSWRYFEKPLVGRGHRYWY